MQISTRVTCFGWAADPLAAIEALGDAILHVHAKDTYFNDGALRLTGRLETIGHENVKDRAWSYITWELATESNGGASSAKKRIPILLM